MKIIGITGKSGSGKSTVCEMLENKYGAKIINADKIAKELSKPGTKYIKEIEEKFGKDILDEDGNLKRKKLADIIFSNEQKRLELNGCTFKYIKKEIIRQIELEKDVCKVIVIDAPLLFEIGLDELCEKILGIISKEEIQLERIMNRDNIDNKHASNRLNAQETNDFFIRKCDDIIENNKGINDLYIKVDEIMKKYNITKILQ